MATPRALRAALGAALLVPGLSALSASPDGPIRLAGGPVDLRDAAAVAARASRSVAPAEAGKKLHLVKLAGPVTRAWWEALVASGVEIVDYVPENAYVVRGDDAALLRARGSAGVVWDGALLPDDKVERHLAAAAKGPSTQAAESLLVSIQLVKDAAQNAATKAFLATVRTGPVVSEFESLGKFVNLVAPVSAAALKAVAERPDVLSIHRYVPPVKMDERQAQIAAGNLTGDQPTAGSYLAWLASKGFTQAQFTTSNFIVDVSDSGIDNATTAPIHPNLYVNGTAPGTSRVAYNRLVGTPTNGSTLQGCDGHGTVMAHVLAGYNDVAGAPHQDASGFHYGLGINPFVKVGSSVIFDPLSYTSPVPANLVSQAYNDGARLSNNSWGFPGSGTYDVFAQAYDGLVRDAQPTGASFPLAGNQEMVVVVAAGNAGPTTGISSPGTGKNVLTVGAAESVRPFGGADQCGYSDSQSGSANDLLATSGRGPTADGRKKPDLVAPGSHVTGGVALTNAVGTGTALGCYNANTLASLGICAGTGALPGGLYFPSGQQFYSAHSGTSVATAAVTGAASLLRQFFLNNSLAVPSPAMTKAMLMSSTRYLGGVGANDTLWANGQGMGSLDMGRLFDCIVTTPVVLRDQVGADLFTATGQTRVFSGTISDNTKPFRVTLAWTDAPGSTVGSAWKNDLDLVVTVGGNTYKGNVFSGAASTPGGSADSKNNVESVFVPAGVTGTYNVVVSAANINSDGVNPGGGVPQQDFALVVYNATTASQPVIERGTVAITAENCPPPNAGLDPGETVTVDLPLTNVGSAATTNLVATLQATGGVSAPSGPQVYGALAPAASATFPFTFTVSATCGALVTATWQLQDGATNLGTAAMTWRVGSAVATSVTYSGPAVPIPDNFPTGVDVPVTVAGFAGTLAYPTLSFDGSSCSATAGSTTVGLDHTFVGDLVVTLRSPLGTTVTLVNRPGGGLTGSSGNNFCQTLLADAGGTGSIQDIVAAGAPYTGTFSPANPLAAFAGEDPNGTWMLNVSDRVTGETGNVRAFTLNLFKWVCCAGTCTTPPTPVAGSNSPVPLGGTLNLTSSTVPGATYAWTGPNGFVAAVQNPSLPNVTLAAAGSYSVVATVAGCPSAPGSTNVVVRGLEFYTLAPCRVVDTRNPNGPFGGPPLVGAGATRDFEIAGQCGVPSDALAAALNVTVVNPSTPGDLRFSPAGAPPPGTSTINFSTGQVRANNAVVRLAGAPAGVTVQNSQGGGGTVDLVIDVNGYFK